MIIRAVVKDGMLQPLQPLPAEWEGQEIEITGRPIPAERLAELEKKWDEIEAIIADTPDDPEDWRIVQELFAEQKKQSKEYMRRQMGLR